MQDRVYVWEAPVRVTHWINVICILALSVTGFYIGNPFLVARETSAFLMGWMRFVHFVVAYIFVVNMAVRIYWAFAGNKYAVWQEILPFTGDRMGKLFSHMSYYAFLGKKPPTELGHTPLASAGYCIMYALFALSAVTGFALYSQPHHHGFLQFAFGWVFGIVSIPATRLLHHLTMWLIFYFVILHIYLVLFQNSTSKSGILGSIFDGYRFVPSKKAGK